MSTTKFTAGVAAVVLILAFGTTVHEALARRDAQRALAATYDEVAALSARLQQLRDHDSRAKKSEAGKPGVTSDSAPQNAEAETARPKPPPTPEELAAAGRAFMERHPEVKQALLERAHARVTAKYGPFYRTWGLAPAQIAQFETLMLETEMWSADGPTGKMWLQAGTGLTPLEAKNRVHEFLGDDGFAQLQEINGNLGTIRQALTQLASATYYTDTPLTAAQAAQITERALTMRSQMKQWYAYLKSNPLGGHSVSEIMQDQVKDVLSPPQREALDGVIQQIVFQRSLGRAMAAASTSSSKSSP